jgi:hypothetical protein
VKDRASTQRELLRDLLDRAFGGSAQEFVMMALKEESEGNKEQEEIKALLESARKHSKKCGLSHRRSSNRPRGNNNLKHTTTIHR